MYNDYFGFSDAPFSIAPNPHFLYMSERHREALAHLLYGIRSDGGFILLTGEVGTGKTTMCRCLLEQVPEDVDTAFILNPKLTARELLAAACDDLGVRYRENASIKELVDGLNRYLLDSLEQGRRTVLIIDEAQNLSSDVLEQLRLLTNLETNQRKLLQIILLGQPELLDVLAQKELRQLSQRITARFHLDALDRRDVESYIAHRLEIAGGNPALFSRAAIRRVWQLSGGIPRLINLICDRALLGTYAQNRLGVDADVVDRAAREIFGGEKKQRPSRWPIAVAAALVLASLSTLMVMRAPSPEPSPVAMTPDVETSDESGVAEVEPAATNSAASANEPAEPEPVVTANLIGDESTREFSLDPLLAVEGDDTMNAAMARLLATWQTPLAESRGEPCDVASRFGLRCLSQLGSLRDIEHFNRPAAIRLSIASISHFVTLTAIDDDVVTITSGNGRYRIRRNDLLRTWDGEFTLLWQTPENYRVVRRGDSGAMVEHLSRQLALVSDGPIETEFSADLENRLKRFQVSVGLTPDGIAGAQTWIHLNAATGSDAPVLKRNRG